jgi:hypothetical protein
VEDKYLSLPEAFGSVYKDRLKGKKIYLTCVAPPRYLKGTIRSKDVSGIFFFFGESLVEVGQ